MTLCALLMAACEDWTLHQVDIVGAYLQGDLKEEIFMKPPDRAQSEHTDKRVWKLLKPLHGLKQAGHQWKAKLDEAMHNLGFIKSRANDCLYVLTGPSSAAHMLILVLLQNAVAVAVCGCASMCQSPYQVSAFFVQYWLSY